MIRFAIWTNDRVYCFYFTRFRINDITWRAMHLDVLEKKTADSLPQFGFEFLPFSNSTWTVSVQLTWPVPRNLFIFSSDANHFTSDCFEFLLKLISPDSGWHRSKPSETKIKTNLFDHVTDNFIGTPCHVLQSTHYLHKNKQKWREKKNTNNLTPSNFISRITCHWTDVYCYTFFRSVYVQF